jgi:hypothetical protein
MAVTRRCGICEDGRANTVNAFIAAGKRDIAIEREMRAIGRPTKAETVKKHRENCLGPDRDQQYKRALASIDGRQSADFAQLVKQEAIRLMNEGELRVRTADGLKAQELLDRREEKKADRDLMINIARLMSGASMEVPDDLVEGEFTEVRELGDGLAPADLIAS